MREDNGILNKTYTYTYDNAGNITSKKTYALTAAGVTPQNPTATDSYTYGNADWGDLLTAYKGQSITYDAVGNPLSYYNGSRYTFSWLGRRLTGATLGSTQMTFEYREDGLRTKKTVGGVVTEYFYDGSLLIAEQTGDTIVMYYYDESGSPIAMQYRDATKGNDVWDKYIFERNLQGDVVAIYTTSGTKLVSYTYDAWGNVNKTYLNGGASTSATYNRLTYRGYYYDTDLQLYYLQSRYYDAKVGRFINADNQVAGVGGEILGYNMFAYCMNNPVNLSDPTGDWPDWMTKLSIGLGAIVIGAAFVAATAATGGAATVFAGAIVAGLKAAAISGAISAAIEAGESAINHRVSTGTWNGAGEAALSGAIDGFANGFMAGGIMAGASQIISGGFKLAANAGVATGRNGGLAIGKQVRVLSPNHPKAYEAGGTLLKIGSKYKNIRFDVGSKSLFHINVQLSKTINYHIPIGTLGAGLFGGGING